MEQVTNHIGRISLFYEKSDPSKIIRGLDYVRNNDATTFCCMKCWDLFGKEVCATSCLRGDTQYGRHYGNKEAYCTKINKPPTKVDNDGNESIDIMKMKPAVLNLINNRHLDYTYRNPCCMLNPNKEVVFSNLGKLSVIPDLENTRKVVPCFKVEYTEDYILAETEEREQFYFLFNKHYKVANKNATIYQLCNVDNFFRAVIESYQNGLNVSMKCYCSHQNKMNVCGDCLAFNTAELVKAVAYIPEKYKNPYTFIPVKTWFIENNRLYIPEVFALLLNEQNHNIELTHKERNPHNIKQLTDNVYDLVYGFQFTYDLREYSRYDFFIAMFLTLLKQKPIEESEMPKIVKKMLKVGFEQYFHHNPNEIALELYKRSFKCIVEEARSTPNTRQRQIDNVTRLSKYQNNSYKDDGELDPYEWLEIEKSCGL